MKDKILLFIPMYNCENQITRVLSQITDEYKNYFSEIIVVNNRSTDNGENAVVAYCENHPELPVRLLRNDENYGLGGSHKVAFNYAVEKGFDYIVVLHGDDQATLSDLMPYIVSNEYEKYDCLLGSRFMKGSKLLGYSKTRILGNYVFNFIFSVVTRKKIYDLGSGLNMYDTKNFPDKYFIKYPDTLYFNDLMILASCHFKHNMLFFPISWREEDQISNNKLFSFSISLLKMLFHYLVNKKAYLSQDLRIKKIEKYSAQIIHDNTEIKK